MKQEFNKTGDLNWQIEDELGEDELTDVELDPVSGGVKTIYIQFPPEFIQVKRPKPTHLA